MVNRHLLLMGLLPLLILISNCASWKNQQGVANTWREQSASEIEIGKTTQSEIIKLLGPPSQVIGLKDQVIFYYMLEKTEGKATILILYNWSDEKIKYDRAIFFFGKKGILTDYAYSSERLSYDE